MATSRSQLIQTFVRTIAHDIKLYQQLLPLLQVQKSLYLQFDGQALNDNLHKQTPILNQLNSSASERSQCLQQLGLSANEHSVNRLLSALPRRLTPQLRQQWATLKGLIKQCQQLNQSNGQSSAAFHELLNQIKHPVQHTYEERSF
ncbi:flagellar export chaperone FlgN [Vibrio sp. CAU 1672]|uniref:flagellar export chaperone FlgN n=1 Tax=Vibrio sp. CAU 1672 TaxID=3032594 RepID=UPI0023DBF6E0|nr:flagellar export chaperone FlgN [Vibrio sp. CAU 1672]MDF2152580.1 flagellar export chaperone FlgN [Vibrio sp. CAU 1672]